ncbi:NUDIX hydrolase [Candidatus Uhrbacteria bacterium]|nr:NUDIX hydrolase [Candidatus Uhrbacteria bacterium]
MLHAWKRLSTQVRFRNPWWEYRIDRFQLKSGKQGEYHYMHTLGGVTVIPVTDEGRILCVSQYRYLLDRDSLEFPGGGIKLGQAPEEAARGELSEETGFEARTLRLIGTFATDAGLLDETGYVFLGTCLIPKPAAADETEEFELVSLLPEEVDSRIASGGLFNGYALAAWAIAKPHVFALLAAAQPLSA